VPITPNTKLSFETKSNGFKYAIITYKFLWWSTVLYEIPVQLEFWPQEFKIPIPKGIRFPKEEPKPTEYEKRVMQDFVEQPGYKILCKFWNWGILTLIYRCTNIRSEPEYEKGRFRGFMEARLVANGIALYTDDPEAQPDPEDHKSLYANMGRMDREAPSEYY